MNLYLSRLCLNPLFAPALKLAADPYALRCRLLATLPCVPKGKPDDERRPKTAELLFRIEAEGNGPVVLLQTGAEPDWEALELAPRALRCPPETKPYAPRFAEGDRLAFRLLCQPTVRQSGDFGLKPNGKRAPGPRRACRDDGQRLEWLRRKAGENGFVVETVGLSLLDWANTKRLQAKGGDAVESHEEARRRAFGRGARERLGAVRFDGILAVNDPEELLRAVLHGIGTQKAFGFGLLSVARA
jgi:CRISPR system Cascade subunit CasE